MLIQMNISLIQKLLDKRRFLQLWTSPMLLPMNISQGRSRRCGCPFIYSAPLKRPSPWVFAVTFRQQSMILCRISFCTECLHGILRPLQEIVLVHSSGNEQDLDIIPPVIRTYPGDIETYFISLCVQQNEGKGTYTENIHVLIFGALIDDAAFRFHCPRHYLRTWPYDCS